MLQVCLFTVRGFFLWVAPLWTLFGSLDSGLWFPCSFYPLYQAVFPPLLKVVNGLGRVRGFEPGEAGWTGVGGFLST